MLKKPRPCKTCGVMQSDGYKYCRPCAALSVVELGRYHADLRKQRTSVEQKPKTHACPNCGIAGVHGISRRCCDSCRVQMRKAKGKRTRAALKADPLRYSRYKEKNKQRHKQHQEQRLKAYWTASQAQGNKRRVYASDKWRAKRMVARAEASDGTITQPWCRMFYAIHTACIYCARPVDRRGLVMDHMQPIALGGAHSITNIAPACHECNAAKGALPLSEWLDSMPQANAVRVHYWLHTRSCAAVAASSQPIVVRRINPAQARKDAMKAWRDWLATAPAWWLDAYWSAHPKPWLRPGLTDVESQRLRYQADSQFRTRKLIRKAQYRERRRSRTEAVAQKVLLTNNSRA